uniref:FHA domain-containing protein n=1 Tax=Plectus sambesii TaxID=2011161 RepID=A0A914V6X4_9BILA
RKPRVDPQWENDQRERRENERKREERRRVDEAPINPLREEEQKFGWGSQLKKEEKEEEPAIEKEKPNFGTSGALAEDTNTFNGVVVKYNEPPEARKPKIHWRLYPFKGEENLQVLYIHRQSAYLVGRDRRVADLPVDHPSCSKQHAVLQYRSISYKREDGSKGRRIRPYIIDLGSGNGTFLNNE